MDGGFGFDFDDIDPDAPGSKGGGAKLPEGGYKFAITEVILKNKNGSTQVECEVLDAKDVALVGKKHIEYLPWPEAGQGEVYNRIKKEQLLAWCYAAKTTNAEEVKARQQARQGFVPAWLENMAGRNVLGFVKQEMYQDKNTGADKVSAKCEGRVWSLDNPKGKGIPGWVGLASGTEHRTAGPATTTPATQAAVPAVDPFAGLV